MKRRIYLFLAILAAALLGVGVHASGRSATSVSSVSSVAVTSVAIDGTSFKPPELKVKVGATVEWINKDPFPHNVNSRSAGLRSGDLDPGKRFTYRATKAGRFDYVCTLHPGMKGTLVVEK